MNTLSSPLTFSSALRFGRKDHGALVPPDASPRRAENRRSRLNEPETEGLARNLFEDRFVHMPADRNAAEGNTAPDARATLRARLEALVRNASIPNGVVILNDTGTGVVSPAYELC
ncbi:hypothetical protein [Vampirovibrio chlorellavorus]|uniref:hypothetical protein n=1 Tax=Vampirovibrio chlorellavorus TaxID=758823 RepID=UPI0026EECAF8|nr:hypothetical protein [Vampirovibrio chlorellavorus]